jgi:hypothetical protein
MGFMVAHEGPEAIEDLVHRREAVIDEGIGDIKDPWLAAAGRLAEPIHWPALVGDPSREILPISVRPLEAKVEYVVTVCELIFLSPHLCSYSLLAIQGSRRHPSPSLLLDLEQRAGIDNPVWAPPFCYWMLVDPEPQGRQRSEQGCQTFGVLCFFTSGLRHEADGAVVTMRSLEGRAALVTDSFGGTFFVILSG